MTDTVKVRKRSLRSIGRNIDQCLVWAIPYCFSDHDTTGGKLTFFILNISIRFKLFSLEIQ